MLAALLAAGAPLGAAAHTRSQSFSTWSLDGRDVRVRFSVAAREATRLPGTGDDLESRLALHLRERIAVYSGEDPCRAGSPQPLAARPGFLRMEIELRCASGPPTRIRIAAFLDAVPSHVHLARLRREGRSSFEHVFTESVQELVLEADPVESDPGGVALLAGYGGLGIAHIASGPDHLAFLLALLLLCSRLREVALVATGFTLGHSLTLSLAVLGWLRPDPGAIEALIGFTIALVAAENVGVRAGMSRGLGLAMGLALAGGALASARRGASPELFTRTGLALFAGCYLGLVDTPQRALRMRPALTLAFGLVHGFGFAGPLRELDLPRERLALALLGFNAGVEMGQLALLAVLWTLGRALARWPAFPGSRAIDLGSAALCGVGVYWFVDRGAGAWP